MLHLKSYLYIYMCKAEDSQEDQAGQIVGARTSSLSMPHALHFESGTSPTRTYLEASGSQDAGEASL